MHQCRSIPFDLSVQQFGQRRRLADVGRLGGGQKRDGSRSGQRVKVLERCSVLRVRQLRAVGATVQRYVDTP